MLFQWCQFDKCTECTFNSDCLGFRVRKFPISTNLDRQDLGIFNANNTQYQGNLMSLFFILQTCSFGKCTGRGGESPRPRRESPRPRGESPLPRREGSLQSGASIPGFYSVLLTIDQFLPIFSLAIVEDGIVTWHIHRVNTNTPKWETPIKTNRWYLSNTYCICTYKLKASRESEDHLWLTAFIVREPTRKVQQQVVHLVLDDDGGVHLGGFVQAFFFLQAPRQWQFFPEIATIIWTRKKNFRISVFLTFWRAPCQLGRPLTFFWCCAQHTRYQSGARAKGYLVKLLQSSNSWSCRSIF